MLPVPPRMVALDDEDGVSEKSCPIPERDTLCGLPAALSVIVNAPDRVPLAVGSKKTPIEQLVPAATVLPQELSWPKSGLVVLTVVIVRGALPVLVSVTVWGRPEVLTYWVGKVRDSGDRLTAETMFVLPVSVAICGLPGPLSEMLSVALKTPRETGVKVTIIWHVAPAPRE